MSGSGYGSETETERNRARAWEIHKDADGLLHSRLASFASSQSFLVGGYIISLGSSGDAAYARAVSWALASLGLLYALGFSLVCSFLVGGLRRLKRNYLFDNDPVYRDFVTRLWIGDRIDGLRAVTEGIRAWIIPYYFPGLAIIFWLFVIGYRIWLLRLPPT